MYSNRVNIRSAVGVITVLELEITIWRKHPNALFTLMRKNPIRDRVDTFWGNVNFPAETRPDRMGAVIVTPTLSE
jgi:hypothetical protein